MVVYQTHDVMDAHIVAGRLEVESIPAMVHRPIGAAALGITIGGLGEIRVLVNPADYERAIEILEPDEQDVLTNTNDTISYYGLDENESE